jgi:hypothetical protein
MPPIVAATLAGIVVFCAILFLMLSRAKSDRAPREDSVPRINRRKEPRIPVTSDFDLFWQDEDASHKTARARGIEISEHGASMRSPKPIRCNSVIKVRGRDIQFDGRATVRRCTKKGLSYIIGLELEGTQYQTVRA